MPELHRLTDRHFIVVQEKDLIIKTKHDLLSCTPGQFCEGGSEPPGSPDDMQNEKDY